MPGGFQQEGGIIRLPDGSIRAVGQNTGMTQQQALQQLIAEQQAQQQAAQLTQQQQQQIQDVQQIINQNQQGAGGGNGSLNPITAPFLPNPTGSIGFENDIEDAWQPGVQEAGEIYNLGQPQLDPNNYLDTTMQNLLSMQDPSMNPYLDSMLAKSNSAISDQVLSSLGRSGRGPGSIDPTTGQVSDSAINLIDAVGDNTRQFLGGQYQQDMNRAMSAMLGGGDFMSGTLQMMQDQPWNNIQNYANITSQLTGTSPQQPDDPRTSGWDRLIGLGTTVAGLGQAGLFG